MMRVLALSVCCVLMSGRVDAFAVPGWDAAGRNPRSMAFVNAGRASSPTGAPTSALFIYAPPGSGYATPEDETSELPDTYEPMMEYPGTMRPGRTRDNIPYQDLPLDDGIENPIPWPHFQQIEWHHRWEPAHDSPIPMEEFIEQQGRWATPEMEAQMRAGIRKSARQQSAAEEADKRSTTILDDDDDDEDDIGAPADLGEGIIGRLGSTDDQAITAAVTSGQRLDTESDDADSAGDDGGLNDFFTDLGLDFDNDEEEDGSSQAASKTDIDASTTRRALEDVVVAADDDDDSDEGLSLESPMPSSEATASISIDEDDDIDLGLDDDDDTMSESAGSMSLDDFDNDVFDGEDYFDDGGFDYGDGDYGDRSDEW